MTRAPHQLQVKAGARNGAVPALGQRRPAVKAISFHSRATTSLPGIAAILPAAHSRVSAFIGAPRHFLSELINHVLADVSDRSHRCLSSSSASTDGSRTIGKAFAEWTKTDCRKVKN